MHARIHSYIHSFIHSFIIHLFITESSLSAAAAIIYFTIYILFYFNYLFIKFIKDFFFHWPLNIYGQTFSFFFLFFLAGPRIFIIHIDSFLALLANFHNKYGKNNYFLTSHEANSRAFNATRQNKKKDSGQKSS